MTTGSVIAGSGEFGAKKYSTGGDPCGTLNLIVFRPGSPLARVIASRSEQCETVQPAASVSSATVLTIHDCGSGGAVITRQAENSEVFPKLFSSDTEVANHPRTVGTDVT